MSRGRGFAAGINPALVEAALKAEVGKGAATEQPTPAAGQLVIPHPLSVNACYRSVRGRSILSKKGRKYRKAGLELLDVQNKPSYQSGERLKVMLELFPPDRRRRDIDNATKSALDLLTHAGVWSDDSQIDELIIRRCPVTKGGRALVTIEVIA